MKRAVLVACAVAGLFSFGYPYQAKADLGDSYQESKHKYGQPLTIREGIVWWTLRSPNETWVGATFYRNQCVAICYLPSEGQDLVESEILRLFLVNSKPGATWAEYYRDENSVQYSNQDATIYGRLDFPSGCLQICYASHLKRHGLLKSPSS